eukprot:2955301-Pyramimonas_sp.AAC.1
MEAALPAIFWRLASLVIRGPTRRRNSTLVSTVYLHDRILTLDRERGDALIDLVTANLLLSQESGNNDVGTIANVSNGRKGAGQIVWPIKNLI